MTSERYIALFNADASASIGLRAAINGLPATKVVTEVSDLESLGDALRRLTVSVLIVNLDPDPDRHIALLERVATQFPDVPIIAMSERTDSQMIIHAMRVGCQQFVFKPLDRDDLRRAVDRVAVSRPGLAPAGRRICVIGASGGVGATTIACNLAMEVAHLTGKTSGVMDLQLEFGDVATSFDAAPQYTLANLCEVDGELDQVMLDTAITRLSCNVAVLGRPRNVAEAHVVTADRVAAVLRLMSNCYDTVVIDTPRSFDRITLNALEMADHVLVVLQLIVPSVRNAVRLYQTLMDYGMPDDRVHIIVNRFRKGVGSIIPEDVQQQFRKDVFAVIPNDYQCVTNSLDFGHPLMADAPNSAVRASIRELASDLLGDEQREVVGAGARNKSSLFGRIFNA
ncbi:MAG: AAA family ATPase [Phycisphaerae bacterium]|nr:AAA family ATPase [Phycisphaerae bacterium]